MVWKESLENLREKYLIPQNAWLREYCTTCSWVSLLDWKSFLRRHGNHARGPCVFPFFCSFSLSMPPQLRRSHVMGTLEQVPMNDTTDRFSPLDQFLKLHVIKMADFGPHPIMRPRPIGLENPRSIWLCASCLDENWSQIQWYQFHGEDFRIWWNSSWDEIKLPDE